MNKNTPKKRQIGPPTPLYINGLLNPLAFNCHSYAWHNSKGDPSDPGNVYSPPFWDNDPYRDTGGYHMIPFSEANQVGDRLVYYAWDEKKQRPSATHSAIVVEVNSKGEATLVASKWGRDGLFIHHPRDIPTIYGLPNPTYRAPNGKIYQSRIYFRKN
ncbi:hypothetical protein [Flavobacterium sp.]|uniref:hypothetical protein n=1 Tax=Flavobacterium sp. TaxID=239 RepID=UPI00262C686E|nr:hypothetical protein [Flavobacterium sp.]